MQWEVDRRTRLLYDQALSHISGDTNYFEGSASVRGGTAVVDGAGQNLRRHRLVIADLNSSADCIFSLPKPAHHLFADDDRCRVIRLVVFAKTPAHQDGNASGLEVVFSYNVS